MLAKANRITSADDYRSVVRRGGAKVAGAHTVSYVRPRDTGVDARFGFIVSKKVGTAVRRNLVRRRLKAASFEAVRGAARPGSISSSVRFRPQRLPTSRRFAASCFEPRATPPGSRAARRRIGGRMLRMLRPHRPRTRFAVRDILLFLWLVPPQPRRAPDPRLPQAHLAALRRRVPLLPELLGLRPRSVQQQGLVGGSLLTGWRILRCNPWSRGGVDDVRVAKHDRYRITPFGWVLPAGWVSPRIVFTGCRARGIRPRAPRSRPPPLKGLTQVPHGYLQHPPLAHQVGH